MYFKYQILHTAFLIYAIQRIIFITNFKINLFSKSFLKALLEYTDYEWQRVALSSALLTMEEGEQGRSLRENCSNARSGIVRVHTNQGHSIIPRLIPQEWREPHFSAAELCQSYFLSFEFNQTKTFSGKKHLVLFLWIYQCTPTNMEETFILGIMPRKLMYSFSTHHLHAVL